MGSEDSHGSSEREMIKSQAFFWRKFISSIVHNNPECDHWTVGGTWDTVGTIWPLDTGTLGLDNKITYGTIFKRFMGQL